MPLFAAPPPPKPEPAVPGWWLSLRRLLSLRWRKRVLAVLRFLDVDVTGWPT